MKPRQTAVVAIVAAILIAAGAYFFFKKDKPKDYDQRFARYIEAYTSGTVSKKSYIRLRLANQVKTMASVGVADERDLFSFSPSLSGKTYWIDAQTIEFRPDEALEPGETYEASFDLDKVTDTEEGLEEFEFDFRVIRPGLSFRHNGLVSQSNTSMDLMKLSGEINTSDEEDAKAVEKTLSAEFPQPLRVKWQHYPQERRSVFTIDSIKKAWSAQQLVLNWSANPINADMKGGTTLRLPAKGAFEVLDIRAVQDREDYILVQFSEPVGAMQDLSGLISLVNMNDLRYTVAGSEVKVYAPVKLEGTYAVNVGTGIENIQNRKLSVAKTANITFENKNPSITISGSGSILPNSGKLLLPFDAINLRAVDVTVIKVYENNVPQFFQSNNYKGDYGYASELRRVAKPVVQKTIRLDEDRALDLHKKNRFTLDLDKIMKAEPGAIYRVVIGFKQAYNVYNCGTDAVSEEEEDSSRGGWSEKIDEDDDFWSRYGNYYPANYRWEDRDNPCTPSFYTSERWANRNLIASNIGLIVKRGNDNSMFAMATDLRTAEPMGGVTLEFLDYQQQLMHTVKTDAEGMAKFDLKRKPYLLVAKNGDERGYLRIDDGTSLPLSRFDVGGDVVQQGLKGFIYGERGVWRPGDSLFVTFVLEDKLKKLPGGYPVTFELYNPKGQLMKRLVNGKPLNGFYTFKTLTDRSAPTGNWLAKIRAGGATFSKTIKIETVMPNRLKISFDNAVLTARWLFGSPASHLKAKVDVNLNAMETKFKGFEQYSFDNPAVKFESQLKTIFEGTLDESGSARVNTSLIGNHAAPGMLRANYTTKVFEAGGNFSIDNFNVPYHVYQNYYGIRTPEGDRLSGMLFTGKDHPVDIVNVDRNGRLLAGSKSVTVELYKLEWRWWWEQDDEYAFANFTQNSFNKLIKKENITLQNGKGRWTLRIDEPEWGRYLILVRDALGGHVSGKTVYVDWPGWAQREQANNPTEASMLSFTANKQKFHVGEEVVLTIPSGKGGRALISIENGSRVLRTFWTKTAPGQTQFRFKAEKDMAPNVFANVTLLQPHAQTVNDLPIRMYGAIPLLVEDPQTILKPLLNIPASIRPETVTELTVAEQQGKAMTYTIALVDEGLLDLTRFKTPDPHGAFYAREGLGVKSWDLFDHVLGAWGGNLERILSIGGDGTINRNLNPAKANRFVPVVKYMGPFALGKGERKTHRFRLPQYIGSVRAMVVAGQDGAYGFTEKTVQVKKPLMLLATLPRVIGPGETFTLPVTVFATESRLKKVSVQVQASSLRLTTAFSQSLNFAKPGEQMAYFELKAPESTGIAKVRVTAQSGAEKAVYDVELDVRNPNPYITNVISAAIEPGSSWSHAYQPIGMGGSNTGVLEISSLPPIDLKKRLGYLTQYPHGCVEQVTSSVFPQLYLSALTRMTEQQKANTERNIKAGIARLRGFQSPDGGLAYWPGASSSDEWGSAYAAHFLLEAQKAGYSLPVGMADELFRYLRSKSSAWVPDSENFYGGDLSQAYRLYVLALGRRADIGAMNRLRGFEYLSAPAKWRLAAAYQLAGQQQAAAALIKGLPLTAEPYKQPGGTYGSELRDQAMILETLTLLGRKQAAASALQSVAATLGQETWYSTQTTAYSLLAIAKFCGANSASASLNYTYTIDGKKGKTNLPEYFSSTPLTFKGGVSLVNTGNRVLFARLILSGQLAPGQHNFAALNPDVLDMKVAYKLLNGKTLDPSVLKQGTDFYAEVTVRNPGKRGDYEQLALTQIFPSGWEIVNTRINDNENILASSPYAYRDIRDDRVFTYFNLRENQSVVYKVLLNASYLGRYYLSAQHCEAMYDQTISATHAGKWVQVVK
ncbi:alpha-2-macroglobulin family protein [Pedobacter deserti]|uniref:alpha-2-macroglobulin family protein n=1 Tax=Pedobacter deserti TaxID=2817382 RepID=UPI00210D3168|nr:MG2 domain-containing protein [Pedobacter sp. SYSU D00382]